ncbi:MAG: electron transfer flavoprotein subunit beta/FixA family protein [Nitrospinae bacterium]|nr:electron transfer flavoprotein subunit beta/FixA family protein [Nitrospinota bacterium]
MLKVVVFIKQVPDTSSKAGVNPDGTIDRARAKRMLNPFDRYALQKAIEIKRQYGAEVTCVTMGPPPAVEVLVEAFEHGADYGILLTDKRLAASDTLATAYALHMVVRHIGAFDVILTGLQTTDGDTAQVGPQIAERLHIAQITYCEGLSISGTTLSARRVVEGGFQEMEVQLPVLITVANSATPLDYKRFGDVAAVKEFLRHPEEREKRIKIVSLDTIGADSARTGLVGSPTVVGKTWKLGEIGGSCVVFQGESMEREVSELIEKLKADGKGVEELINA